MGITRSYLSSPVCDRGIRFRPGVGTLVGPGVGTLEQPWILSRPLPTRSPTLRLRPRESANTKSTNSTRDQFRASRRRKAPRQRTLGTSFRRLPRRMTPRMPPAMTKPSRERTFRWVLHSLCCIAIQPRPALFVLQRLAIPTFAALFVLLSDSATPRTLCVA